MDNVSKKVQISCGTFIFGGYNPGKQFLVYYCIRLKKPK